MYIPFKLTFRCWSVYNKLLVSFKVNVCKSLTADLQTSHLVLSVPKAEVANSTYC